MTDVSSVTNTVLTTLDIGSGIDSTKLARDLTNAVKIPQENNIQEKIDLTEASISAYGLVKLAVNNLKSNFEKINDANELATSSGTTTDTTKMTLSSVAGSAISGAYDFTISQLAQNQRVISDQYSTKTQSLNSGSAFTASLAIGATKSAVSAIYNATAAASETTTLVVGDGTNTVSIASASYNSIADQVTAIRGGTGYDNLLFTAHENSAGNGIEFRYKTSGSVTSTPTFTGTGSSHTVTNPTVGVTVSTPVSGVAAEYNFTGTAAETTTLVVSDGNTTVSVDSASYANIAAQVTAIQGATGYSSLKFTVAQNAAGDGFKFTYKTTGAVTTAPTLTGSGSTHTVSTLTTGVTAVNAPTTTTFSVATDTPVGVVNAINAANTGVKATLMDTGTDGNNYRIILSGQTGSDSVFTFTSTPDLGFHDTANNMQSAQDSIINHEGLVITRSSNQLTDVIQGATINLHGVSVSNVTLSVSNDRSTLRTNIEDIITSYNDVVTLFDNFTASDSEAELAGSLNGDTSMVRLLKDKIHTAIFANSSTGAGSIAAIRDIGVSIDRYGTMTLDETKYDAAVLSDYDNVVTMLTADTSDQNLFETSNKGLAQDVATVLGEFTKDTGIVHSRETTTNAELTKQQDALVKLEKRMEVIYNRYLKQFGAMETLMATIDSTKDYLTSQFETLSKAYEVD